MELVRERKLAERDPGPRHASNDRSSSPSPSPAPSIAKSPLAGSSSCKNGASRVRSSESKASVEFVREQRWAERDAELRAAAVDLVSSPSPSPASSLAESQRGAKRMGHMPPSSGSPRREGTMEAHGVQARASEVLRASATGTPLSVISTARGAAPTRPRARVLMPNSSCPWCRKMTDPAKLQFLCNSIAG